MVVYPAGDIKDTWIAHSLDFDVVTQGKSQVDAIAMLDLAFDELVDYRIFLGLPPVAPKPAPEELWKLAEAAFGEKLPREPVSVWVSSKKLSSTNTKPSGEPPLRPTTYISQHPPTLHAGAV